MDSLNGFSIELIKKEISNNLKYDISFIKLFGSRINGGWTNDSDLDIAIKDEKRSNEEILHKLFFGIKCEIRFVENFNVSWLKNCV